MKVLMTYRSVTDFLPLAQQHGPGHVARLHEFHARGVLLMAGTLQEPMNGDAIAVFVSRQDAEEFVAGDPFVLGGVVAGYDLRPWDEVLAPDGPVPPAPTST